MSSTVRLHMAPPFITKSPRASERSLDALTRMLSGTIDRTIASRDWQIVAKWKAPSAARQHNHCPVQLACRLWERQINQAEWKRNEFQCTENSHSNGFTLLYQERMHAIMVAIYGQIAVGPRGSSHSHQRRDQPISVVVVAAWLATLSSRAFFFCLRSAAAGKTSAEDKLSFHVLFDSLSRRLAC